TDVFSEGRTLPLYRLLAATWQRHRRVDATRFEGRSVEIAFYLDRSTGRLLERLTMPLTGRTVDVPLFRSGPSPNTIVAAEEAHEDFQPTPSPADGGRLFGAGRSERYQWLGAAQRDGGDFLIRQQLGMRVLDRDGRPTFFYHESTTTRAPWRAINAARVSSAPCEVQYASLAAFRPWMQMGDVPGHTVQSGRGAKVLRAADLPRELAALIARYHPDLYTDAAAVLADRDR
ncbi:MAG: DUF1838 domain-containing protein, partial [Steroidobacteraceae bacterium]|nr:DUF1838 domain-containing protein [Steroidobacteraceae bacterium]MDW8258583.1 DUF1838 family protein [Gammaproteobacteria bacterium]